MVVNGYLFNHPLTLDLFKYLNQKGNLNWEYFGGNEGFQISTKIKLRGFKKNGERRIGSFILTRNSYFILSGVKSKDEIVLCLNLVKDEINKFRLKGLIPKVFKE